MAVSTEAAKAFYDAKIAELSAQLETYRGLRAAIDSPAIAEQLVHLLTNGAPVVSAPYKSSGTGKASGTNFERVAALFAARDNDWLPAPEVAAQTGINRGVVANLLYKTNKNDFESKDHPRIPNRKLWRLKQRNDS